MFTFKQTHSVCSFPFNANDTSIAQHSKVPLAYLALNYECHFKVFSPKFVRKKNAFCEICGATDFKWNSLRGPLAAPKSRLERGQREKETKRPIISRALGPDG